MTIQYLSDLHLEFRENLDFIQKYPIVAEGDVLLLAGDIMPLRQLREEGAFLNQISEHFKAVYSTLHGVLSPTIIFKFKRLSSRRARVFPSSGMGQVVTRRR
ncbi:MAG: hypothetical protein IPH31_02400 [Lewinellaceae bacterium]|nr:hypothetical protein [Lewinellaceae bacterium]